MYNSLEKYIQFILKSSLILFTFSESFLFEVFQLCLVIGLNKLCARYIIDRKSKDTD